MVRRLFFNKREGREEREDIYRERGREELEKESRERNRGLQREIKK